MKFRCILFPPVLVLCTLSCPPLPNAGELYIWTDNEGVTHASDRPPLEKVRLDGTIKFESLTEERKQEILSEKEAEIERARQQEAEEERKKKIQRQQQMADEERARARATITRQNSMIRRLANQARDAEERALDAETELWRATTGFSTRLQQAQDENDWLRGELEELGH